MSIHCTENLCVLGIALLGIMLCPNTYIVGIKSEMLNQKDFLGYYEYNRSLPLNVAEELIKGENHYSVSKVYFDSVNGERVPGLLSLPKQEMNVPCVVFLHGYGGKKEDILTAAELIAREGYSIMAIDAEYHGERREEGKELYSPNVTDSVRGIIQTVIDLCRAVDYLETRPVIDKDKIGYAEGSMGGIIGAIFIGVEPRIKAASLIIAGGNMSLMVRESQHHTMPAIRDFLQSENITYEEAQELLDPIDPINFISNFSPRPLVFHLGKFDKIVPSEAGKQLYEGAGSPKGLCWYDSGHDVPLDLVLARTLDFMDRSLLGKSFVYHELEYWTIRYGAIVGIVAVVFATSVYLGRRTLKSAIAKFVTTLKRV